MFETGHSRSLRTGVGSLSPLWPAFAMAAVAGTAFWWWRRMGEMYTPFALPQAAAKALAPPLVSALPTAVASAGSAFPPTTAPTPKPKLAVVDPVAVMEHAPPPASEPEEANPSDARLDEPAPALMTHTPPETVGVTVESDGAVKPAPRKAALKSPARPPEAMSTTAAVLAAPASPPKRSAAKRAMGSAAMPTPPRPIGKDI